VKFSRSALWRILRWAAATLAVLLVVLGAGGYVLLATPKGLPLVLRLTERLTGGVVRAQAAGGALWNRFELKDVVIATSDGTRITARRLAVKWQPMELVTSGRVHIDHGTLTALAIDIPASSGGSSGKTALPTRLPVDLAIDDLQAQGFSYTEGSGKPLQLDRVELRGRWLGDRVDIDTLKTELPQLGPLRFAARTRVQSDRLQLYHAQLTSGAAQVDLAGVLGMDDVPSDLNARWQKLSWPLNSAKPWVADLHGSAQLRGSLHDYRFRLDAAAPLHGIPAALQAQGSGSLSAVQIEQLNLQAAKASAKLQGGLTWSPSLRANLALSTSDLDPGVLLPEWKGDINATAQTQTTMVDGHPQLSFSADVANSTLRGYPLVLKAQGSSTLKQAHIEQATLKVADGSLQASGTLRWLPQLTIDADLQLDKLNPAAFAPGWDGRLNGHMHVHTQDTAQPPTIAFDAQLRDSRLRDYPLTLDSRGTLRGQAVTLDELQARLGKTQLSASGRVTPPFAAKAQFDSPDLGSLYPGLGGSLNFSAQLDGDLQNPHLVTQGSARRLRYQTERVAKASWNGDLQPKSPSHFSASIDGAEVGLTIEHASLIADGVEVYHHLQLEATTQRGSVAIGLQGGYDRKRREWGGELSSLRLEPQGLAPWSLQKPAGLLLGSKRRSLEPACLVSNGGSACLNMQRAVLKPGLEFGATLHALQLASFKPILPPEIDIAGQLDGQGRLRWVDGNVADAKADVRLTQGHIGANGKAVLDIEPATLQVDQDGQGVHGVLDVESPRGQIRADLRMAPAPLWDQRPLSGNLQMKVPDIGFLQPFTRELQSLRGHIDGALSFAGTVGLPQIGGSLTLSDGAARLNTPGIDVTDVALTVSGNGSGPLRLDGSMHSGGGSMSLNGTVDPSKLPPRADVMLGGDKFQVMNTRDARIWATPALRLVSDAQGARLFGALIVPKAELTPSGFEGGVSASPDQVIVGAPPAKASALPKLSTTIAFVLGDDVHFTGFGLTTQLDGTVDIIDEPDRPARAMGQVRLVNGRYKAYGQNLTIKTGQLIFTGGPVTRPAVNLYAVRQPAQDITVGVRVRGTLDHPQLSLDSTPAMAREQQLSWLLLGRPLDENSTQDRSLVASAALSLGLTGGDFLAQQIGKHVGLDQISVGTAPAASSPVAADPRLIQGSQAAQTAGSVSAASQAAQLTLGKYLTPKLFVSYGVSLFQPGQTFRILYDLGHGFKVQTESGAGAGGDLLYTFESGD
jgi:translocation and assembly module TamB